MTDPEKGAKRPADAPLLRISARLQTLARGINVVALDSQPRDVIDLHAKMFKKQGMTTLGTMQ